MHFHICNNNNNKDLFVCEPLEHRGFLIWPAAALFPLDVFASLESRSPPPPSRIEYRDSHPAKNWAVIIWPRECVCVRIGGGGGEEGGAAFSD